MESQHGLTWPTPSPPAGWFSLDFSFHRPNLSTICNKLLSFLCAESVFQVWGQKKSPFLLCHESGGK